MLTLLVEITSTAGVTHVIQMAEAGEDLVPTYVRITLKQLTILSASTHTYIELHIETSALHASVAAMSSLSVSLSHWQVETKQDEEAMARNGGLRSSKLPQSGIDIMPNPIIPTHTALPRL